MCMVQKQVTQETEVHTCVITIQLPANIQPVGHRREIIQPILLIGFSKSALVSKVD